MHVFFPQTDWISLTLRTSETNLNKVSNTLSKHQGNTMFIQVNTLFIRFLIQRQLNGRVLLRGHCKLCHSSPECLLADSRGISDRTPWVWQSIYSALRKYSAPLKFATFCHISGFKHKDIKLYFFVKNQQQVGHNHEVELHESNFFNKSKIEKLGVQNYSAPLLSVQQTLSRSLVRISELSNVDLND